MTLALAKKESAKMRALYLARYFADGCVYGFLPAYFLLAFTDPWQVGILLASMPVTALLGNFAISRFTADERRNLALMKLLIPVEAIFICTIGFVRFSFGLTLVSSLIGNFVCTSIYNLLDAVGGDVLAVEGGKFSSLRAFGALGYLFGALAIGFLVDAFAQDSAVGYSYAFACILPVYLAVVLLALSMSPFDLAKTIPSSQGEKASYKAIFADSNFVLYALFSSLLIGVVFIADNAYTDYWNLGPDGNPASNNSPSSLGISTAIFELVEFLSGMALSFLLTKRNLKLALWAGGVASLVRLVGLGVLTAVDVKSRWGFSLPSMSLLMGVNALRGVAFGCFTGSFVPILSEVLGLKGKTRGLFVVTFGYGLVSGIGQLTLKQGIASFKGVSASSGHFPLFFLLAAITGSILLLLPFLKTSKRGEAH